MADIFISHCADDHVVAQQLAAFLEGQGWTVWWDKSLLRGYALQDASMAELGNAELVIVVWSKASITAAFVLQEAIAARDVNKLMHVANSDAQPKQIPVRRGNEPLHDASDYLQISIAVLSFMNLKGRSPGLPAG